MEHSVEYLDRTICHILDFFYSCDLSFLNHLLNRNLVEATQVEMPIPKFDLCFI
jgi:hypothetical protein